MLISASVNNANTIAKHNVFFLFGNDEGLLQYSRQQILQHFDPTSANTSVYNFQSAKQNVGAIAQESMASSLFGEQKVIVIDGIAGNVSEKWLDSIRSKALAKFVLVAGSIKKTSKLFKYFNEKRNDVLTVQCYQLSLADVAKFIMKYLNNKQKTISYQNAEFLASLLPLNIMMVERELEKLLNLTHNKNEVHHDDIARTCQAAAMVSLDNICYELFTNPKNAIEELDSLLQNEMGDAILLLRTLQNNVKRLLAAKLYIKNGLSSSEAMLKLKPPVFFKFKDKFSYMLNNSSIPQLKTMLKNLIILEKTVKLQPNLMKESIVFAHLEC